MKKALAHEEEKDRLDVLAESGLDTMENDERFDAITHSAKEELGVMMCTVTLVKEHDEVYLSCAGSDQVGGEREISFCGHALLQEDILIVQDTLQDPRFSDNPYVIGEPFIRFYAGMRLIDRRSGLPLGVFCVKDNQPRELSVQSLGKFMEYATWAEELLQEILL